MWKVRRAVVCGVADFETLFQDVLAKSGMKNLGPDVSLALRTCVIFTLVIANALLLTGGRPLTAVREATPRDLTLLALSGVTAALSWIFYFRAMQSGTVSLVALVDKGSILITLLLSFWLLHEPFTPKIALGSTLILSGIGVLTWKR